MILAKKSILDIMSHLDLDLKKITKRPLTNQNKQYFLRSHFQKLCTSFIWNTEKCNLLFSHDISIFGTKNFVYEVGGSNLKILTPEMDHMAGNCQNYWIPSKNYYVKKTVPKIYRSPRALGLKLFLIQ